MEDLSRSFPSTFVLDRVEMADGLQSSNELDEKYSTVGRQVADYLESGSYDGSNEEAITSLCMNLLDAIAPKFGGLDISSSMQKEEAPHVPGVKVQMDPPRVSHNMGDAMNEFSSIPHFTAVFDASTMVPQGNVDEVLQYSSAQVPDPSPEKGDRDSLTRSSIKNMNSFALRSKEFTLLKSSLSTNANEVQKDSVNDTRVNSMDEYMSNFSSSPTEFLSPYETTHSHIFSQ